MGDVVLEQLQAATDGHARTALETDAVDSLPAQWVASPGSAREVQAVMRVTAANDLAVVARGWGTKLSWGTPPQRLDLILDMTRMHDVVEHVAGDLIVVVGAGCRLSDLQTQLCASTQWLAVDPPRNGTIGGMVATAVTGPTRLLHGPVRDLVIGMRMVRADGVAAHSGGKVVKNVAGYDVGKLLTGSYGTLGIITEVAFRLHPLPVARSWVSAPVASTAGIHALVQALNYSQLVPTAVELDLPASGEGTLTVLLEGIPPGVAARTAAAVELLGPQASASDQPPQWWGAEPFESDGVAVKLTHEIAGLPHLLTALDAACAATGLSAHLRGSVAVGVVLVGLVGAPQAREVVRFVATLRERSAAFGGTVVVLDADPEVKASLDPWGPVGALQLMRSVKAQFDPERRLAPGRFVGGI
jgi:glycolate oxidase FAD binding subunit